MRRVDADALGRAVVDGDEHRRLPLAGPGGGQVGAPHRVDRRLARSRKTVIDEAKPYVNYEIIYIGMAPDTLRLTYREHSPDNLARAAFF